MKKKRFDSERRILNKGETQRNDGTYMFRWTDVLRKQHCIYATTLEELRRKEETVELEGLFKVSRTGDTLNDQIQVYLKTKVKLAASTRENYKYYFKHVIQESFLGRQKIEMIKKTDIRLFYGELSEDGYSVGTVKIIHKIIRPALQLAYEDGAILKNPADGCMKDYVDDEEKKYAITEAEEVEFFFRIINQPRRKRYMPMYAILLKTGIRISELIGLTWDDVDMEKRRIRIDHQVMYRTIDGKARFYATKTKTGAGNRFIPMLDNVYELFLEQRKIWLRTKKDTLFSVGGYRNFVFVSPMSGRCMNANNIRRMMHSIVDDWNPRREMQLPVITPHILRHTFCCRLSAAGCDIKVLQYIMGQKDIRVTMQVYNHVNQERIQREIKRLECENGIAFPDLHKMM